MKAGAGTGRKGRRYHYYVCTNPECRFKAPADEVEEIVLERIRYLASDRGVLSGIVAATNEKLRAELPGLRGQRDLLEKDLENVKNTAEGLISEWAALASGEGTRFLKEKLDDLARRRRQIEESLTSLATAMSEVEMDAVNQRQVVEALGDFTEVFGGIKPYRQKELMRLVVHKAILGPDYMKMALYGRPPDVRQLHEGDSRFQTLEWLPGPDSNSCFQGPNVKLKARLLPRSCEPEARR